MAAKCRQQFVRQKIGEKEQSLTMAIVHIPTLTLPISTLPLFKVKHSKHGMKSKHVITITA